MSSDTEYYRARISEERERAAAAASQEIAAIHLDLAANYEKLIKELEQSTFWPEPDQTADAAPRRRLGIAGA